MISRSKPGVGKLKFNPKEDKVFISLSCTCGSPINKLIGFGIARGEDAVSYVACECQSGDKLIIALVDVANMVEMPKECIQ